MARAEREIVNHDQAWELAFKIADKAAQSTLGSETGMRSFAPETDRWWYDVNWPVTEMSKADVAEAYEYAVLRGLLRFHPEHANLFRFRDDAGERAE